MNLYNLYFDAAVTRPWRWGSPIHDHRQPHLVRLAFVLEGYDGQVILRHSSLVRPLDAWLPFHTSEISRHNATEDAARTWGEPLEHTLARFLAARRQARCVIAHSADFHKRAVVRSFGDIGQFSTSDGWPTTFCTMTQGAPVVKALNATGKQKWPTLAEAHAHFSGGDTLMLPDDPIQRGLALVDAVRSAYHGLQNVRETTA